MLIHGVPPGSMWIINSAIKHELAKLKAGWYPQSFLDKSPAATILILEDADSYFETVQAIAQHTTSDAPPSQGLIS